MKLINYIAGYVRILIEGSGIERFINQSLQNDISIWGVRRKNRTAITAYIELADFYKLRPIVRRTGCRVHVERRYGAPFIYTRNRGRHVMLVGWALVMAAVFALSRYVWFIDINGCSDIGEGEICGILNDMSIHSGMKRTSFTTADIGNELCRRDERIAWASARLSGVKLIIDIVEADKGVEIKQAETAPVSIYAKKEGVIESIVALTGRACVKPGDAVKKGQLLITGDLRSEGAPAFTVHASGEVYAKVNYSFEMTLGRRITGEARTGRTCEYCEISIFGKRFFKAAEEYEKYELEPQTSALIKNFFLPFTVLRGTCFEIGEIEHEAGPDELKEFAMQKLWERLERELPKDAYIISKSSEVKVGDDERTTVILRVTARENIGMEAEIGGE